MNLADSIRNGGISFEDQNTAPAGNFDTYSVTTGNVLTANMVTLPDNGTIAFSADGSFDYTPVEGFTGTDTFTYVADDGSVSSGEIAVSIGVGSVSEDSSEEDEALIQAVDVALALLVSDADADSP